MIVQDYNELWHMELKMVVKLVCHSLLAFNGLRLMGMSFIARKIIHSLET